MIESFYKIMHKKMLKMSCNPLGPKGYHTAAIAEVVCLKQGSLTESQSLLCFSSLRLVANSCQESPVSPAI